VSEHETYAESEITCPYCGYEYTESYEYDSSDLDACGEEDCPDCEKKFKWSRNTSITYSTSGMCEENGIGHDWKFDTEARPSRYDYKFIAAKHCRRCGDCQLLEVNQETGEILVPESMDFSEGRE
jgi:hypothetical protein